MDLINDGTDRISILKSRDLERQLNIQKKKEDKNLITADNEKLEFFEKVFAEKQNYIEDLITSSSTVPEPDLPNHFNKISKEILILQKYVAASNIFLRNYDIKKCQIITQELTEKAKQFEDDLLPKKKFGFKNKTKPKLSTVNLNSHSKDEVDCKPSRKKTEYSCGFSNKSNETLTLLNDKILKNDVFVENLENCKVIFKGSPSTLHLNNLKNCHVFSGPVSTSIFANNCENCTLVIACQQLRLHSSKNVNIYLHVTSRAIMEDCNEIFVAPFNWNYEGIKEDFKQAGLDISVSNWRCVDDFNWLSIEKPSPNWKKIEEENRIQKWDCHDGKA